MQTWDNVGEGRQASGGGREMEGLSLQARKRFLQMPASWMMNGASEQNRTVIKRHGCLCRRRAIVKGGKMGKTHIPQVNLVWFYF